MRKKWKYSSLFHGKRGDVFRFLDLFKQQGTSNLFFSYTCHKGTYRYSLAIWYIFSLHLKFKIFRTATVEILKKIHYTLGKAVTLKTVSVAWRYQTPCENRGHMWISHIWLIPDLCNRISIECIITTNCPKPEYILYNLQETQRILTFEKLEQVNVWHSSFINDFNIDQFSQSLTGEWFSTKG